MGSTHYQIGVICETVLRNFQVVWGGSFTSSARQVIMAAVARAKPTAPVPSIRQWDAPQVSAHTHHHQPLQEVLAQTELQSSICAVKGAAGKGAA